MALTNEELQGILGNLTPEEQKQLYHQLSRNISNTEPTIPKMISLSVVEAIGSDSYNNEICLRLFT